MQLHVKRIRKYAEYKRNVRDQNTPKATYEVLNVVQLSRTKDIYN